MGVCPDHYLSKDGFATLQVPDADQAVDTCCTATCEAALNGGQCPATHVASTSIATTECVDCNHDEAVANCCAPATCGDVLDTPCDEIDNHDWESGQSAGSTCVMGEQPCNKAEAFHQCCKTVQSAALAAQTMKYCTLQGDPHIRTFAAQDLISSSGIPNTNHVAYQTGVKWLVNHDKVKIQGKFIGTNGASTLGRLAIKVDGILVKVDAQSGALTIKVNGHSEWDDDYVEVVHNADLAALGYAAYQQYGHQEIQSQAHGSDWIKKYIRFPLFKDEGAERSYVEVYVQGKVGHLDAAIFMMKSDDFEARDMSEEFSGLCFGGLNANQINVVAQDNLIGDVQDDLPWPEIPMCSSSQRTTLRGLCDACLSPSIPNRAQALDDCEADRCAGEPDPESNMDCDFLNSLR